MSYAEANPERTQFRKVLWQVGSLFPDMPEGRLWREVFMQAVADASEYIPGDLNTYHATEAHWYLNQPVIPACDNCDIDSDYTRRVLGETGLLR